MYVTNINIQTIIKSFWNILLIPLSNGTYNKSAVSIITPESNDAIIPYLDPYWIVDNVISSKNKYLYSFSHSISKYIGKEMAIVKNISSIIHFILILLGFCFSI